MTDQSKIQITASRRRFLQGAGAASLGLVVGFHWMPRNAMAQKAAAGAPAAINAFIRIAPDNTVTVLSKHLEMGQGTYTGLATIVAEELDADWKQMRTEGAPADAKLYANLAFGTIQGTGGSTAMANSWTSCARRAPPHAPCWSAPLPNSGKCRRRRSPCRRAW